jgi:hypothetical protein
MLVADERDVRLIVGGERRQAVALDPQRCRLRISERHVVPRAAAVHPHDCVHQRTACAVDGDDRHVLRGHRDRLDAPPVEWRVRERAPAAVTDGAPPGLGVLLRSATGEERRREWRGRGRKHVPLEVDHGHFHAARAEIDRKHCRHAADRTASRKFAAAR